jgi:hypothetical protein
LELIKTIFSLHFLRFRLHQLYEDVILLPPSIDDGTDGSWPSHHSKPNKLQKIKKAARCVPFPVLI